MEIPREIVVDANILFSFFKAGSSRRNVFKRLLDKKCKVLSPDFVLEEIYGLRNRIKKFCKINEEGFSYLFSILKSNIDTIPKKRV